jgi:hypothetical protein
MAPRDSWIGWSDAVRQRNLSLTGHGKRPEAVPGHNGCASRRGHHGGPLYRRVVGEAALAYVNKDAGFAALLKDALASTVTGDGELKVLRERGRL